MIQDDKYPMIHVHGKDLPKTLLRWGIVPRKTYNFQEPNIPKHLLSSYLRGWFDGDGSMYRYGNSARFTISGNIEGLQWYANALAGLGYDNPCRVSLNNINVGILYIGGGRQVEQVCSILRPNDNEFALERKWHVRYSRSRKGIITNESM
jgi:hypothetical protein